MQNNNQEPLTDESSMPFGMHKGKKMRNVPASYLHWLWKSQKLKDETTDVANYIRANLSALKKEHTDGIW